MTHHGAASGVSGSTSASLIRRVRDHDALAWQRLADIYTPLVYSWARRFGLNSDDAADAVQDVFRSVHRGLSDYQREQAGTSFRGWLRAITQNAVRMHFRRAKQHPQATGGTEATLQLQQLPAESVDTEGSALEEHRRLLHRTLRLIRGDFNETTWQAFYRTTLESAPAPTVAQELGISHAAVRQARHRVLRRLREELSDQLED